MISSEMTVREVTAQVPESTRIFEKLKIDYCCGGGRPLIEACDSAGVEVDSVIEMLSDLNESEAQAYSFGKKCLVSKTCGAGKSLRLVGHGTSQRAIDR